MPHTRLNAVAVVAFPIAGCLDSLSELHHRQEEARLMPRSTMIVLTLVAAVMWSAIAALELSNRSPTAMFTPLPADGSAPPLPAPIEIR
jgi:hypothetical protein